jgi:hypothetical protein
VSRPQTVGPQRRELAAEVEDLLAIDPGPIEWVAVRLRTSVKALQDALYGVDRADLLWAMAEYRVTSPREWRCGVVGCKCDLGTRRKRAKARTAVAS